MLVALSMAFAVGASRAGEKTGVRRASGLLCWAAAGFFEGRVAIARPEESARHAFHALPAARDRADRIEGVLTDFWSDSPPRGRGRLSAERLRVGGEWREFRAEVFLFVSGTTSVEKTADRGDRVSITGHLRREDLPASERDIRLPWTRYRLSVKSAHQVRKLGGTLLSVLAMPNRSLHGRLPAAGSRGKWFDRDVRGPLAALLLGRTSELDRGMVARYRRGGLYHLLVVSGMHVGLAAALVVAALGLVRVGGKTRDALLLAAISLFVLVGGANPPAIRAGVVVAVFLAARLFERPIPPGQAIGLSALVLFLGDPKQIYSIGTVLTFAAVGGIALATEPIRRRLPARPDALFTGLATSLAAQCATAPILFWRFNVVAAGAWLTAPLAIPLSAVLIVLGALLLALFALGLPAGIPVGLFALGSRALELLADRAAGAAYLRPTPALGGIVAVGALTAAASALPARMRAAAAAGAVALFAALAIAPGRSGPAQGFSVEALDVGQGDAILVRWQDRVLLVDGGGPFDVEAADFGRTRLLPKLLDRGVTRLDAVLATHPHPDHVLGLLAVLEELPVDALWISAGDDEAAMYASLRRAATESRIPVSVLRPGRRTPWLGADLTFLHSGGLRRKRDPVNNQSVVLRFERDGRSAVLTGDIGSATEGALVTGGRVAPADLLKVAHHGSRTSTTSGFVAAVRPRAALLSCGRDNRFGHPAPETLETLRAAGARVLRTDRLSDVRVDLAPEATRLAWRGLE